MTAVRAGGTARGGGLRSMGASLLDHVLAETLDPAYRQAAEARAAREQAGTARPRRRWRGQLLVALTLAMAGLLVAVTYNQTTAGAKGRAQVREALLGDIDHETTTTDDLAAQLDRLHNEANRTRDAALRASTVGQQAMDALAAQELTAAAVPVTGPGLLVTLANAAPSSDSDPVGSPGTVDARGQVQDGDLQLVVNALWAAGAEAISINGQRLGPTSTIRFAGEAVLVDFAPVTSPYRISAVGDRDALSKGFLASPDVQALAVVSESFGLRFEFARKENLSLPAATPTDLHYAAAVPPAVPSSGASSSGTPSSGASSSGAPSSGASSSRPASRTSTGG